MGLPEIKDILRTADGITDKAMESDEVAELIVEINDLDATILTLREFPARICKEVNDKYEEARQKRYKAEISCEEHDADIAIDPNYAYWEGRCHALAEIKRAMAI